MPSISKQMTGYWVVSFFARGRLGRGFQRVRGRGQDGEFTTDPKAPAHAGGAPAGHADAGIAPLAQSHEAAGNPEPGPADGDPRGVAQASGGNRRRIHG